MAALALSACTPRISVPHLATQPYPMSLHSTQTVDIQCFRRGTQLEIVNATAQSYTDFHIWLNQRYVSRIASLPAGQTVRVSLWGFVDEWGQRFYAGGFFRSFPAEPVRLAQIQTSDTQPMVGLIAIRSELITAVEKQ